MHGSSFSAEYRLPVGLRRSRSYDGRWSRPVCKLKVFTSPSVRFICGIFIIKLGEQPSAYDPIRCRTEATLIHCDANRRFFRDLPRLCRFSPTVEIIRCGLRIAPNQRSRCSGRRGPDEILPQAVLLIPPKSTFSHTHTSHCFQSSDTASGIISTLPILRDVVAALLSHAVLLIRTHTPPALPISGCTLLTPLTRTNSKRDAIGEKALWCRREICVSE